MIPKELKNSWLKSDSHQNIANHMVLHGDCFAINNIKLTLIQSNRFGIHIEFLIDDEMEFITIVSDSLIKRDVKEFTEEGIFDLIVSNKKNCILVNISSCISDVCYEYSCKYLTMGPIHGKTISI